jgi:hypothetical protein
MMVHVGGLLPDSQLNSFPSKEEALRGAPGLRLFHAVHLPRKPIRIRSSVEELSAYPGKVTFSLLSRFVLQAGGPRTEVRASRSAYAIPNASCLCKTCAEELVRLAGRAIPATRQISRTLYDVTYRLARTSLLPETLTIEAKYESVLGGNVMSNESPTNHGEGNPEAADRFNTAEREFVDSARGKKKIHEGPQVQSDEEAGLAKAEELGRQRAKADDSAPAPSPTPDD